MLQKPSSQGGGAAVGLGITTTTLRGWPTSWHDAHARGQDPPTRTHTAWPPPAKQAIDQGTRPARKTDNQISWARALANAAVCLLLRFERGEATEALARLGSKKVDPMASFFGEARRFCVCFVRDGVLYMLCLCLWFLERVVLILLPSCVFASPPQFFGSERRETRKPPGLALLSFTLLLVDDHHAS